MDRSANLAFALIRQTCNVPPGFEQATGGQLRASLALNMRDSSLCMARRSVSAAWSDMSRPGVQARQHARAREASCTSWCSIAVRVCPQEFWISHELPQRGFTELQSHLRPRFPPVPSLIAFARDSARSDQRSWPSERSFTPAVPCRDCKSAPPLRNDSLVSFPQVSTAPGGLGPLPEDALAQFCGA